MPHYTAEDWSGRFGQSPDSHLMDRREQYPLPAGFEVATGPLALPTARLEVTGRNWFVHWQERSAIELGSWMVRLEPNNPVDPNAVAVFIKDRQVGYLYSGKASFYSRALRKLGGSLEVEGEQDEFEYWVHLPQKKALRDYLEQISADRATT